MKCALYTLNKRDLGVFTGLLPEEVTDHAGEKGFFMLGAVDESFSVLGMTQFYIGIMPDGEINAEIRYVYVKEPYRNHGIAAQMVSKVHRILKNSGVVKSLALLNEEEAQNFFKENGYLLTKVDEDTEKFLAQTDPERKTAGMPQGVHWVAK